MIHYLDTLWSQYGLVLVFLYLLYLINKANKYINRQVSWDHPLHQVFHATIHLRDEFFSEALRLPSGKISQATMRLRAVSVELQIWKDHYSGEITFWGKSDPEDLGYEVSKREKIFETPTSSYQFPAKCELLDLTVPTKPHDFGKSTTEKLQVLLSHRAIILRACDGRFWDEDTSWPLHRNDPRPTDLVIPIREDDLYEYKAETPDDADWNREHGLERFYKRSGRWADWGAWSVSPRVLFGESGVTSRLDAGPVKLNDGGKSAL
jgi:hypothetical protein